MDYSELKSLLTKNNVSVNEAASLLGYKEENSFKPSFVSGKMYFSRVPLLCKLAGISPNELFGWEVEGVSGSGNYASHISGGNTQNSNEAIIALKEELKEKGGIIKEKDKQINRLFGIIEKGKKQ